MKTNAGDRRGDAWSTIVDGATRFYEFYLLNDALFNFVDVRPVGCPRPCVDSSSRIREISTGFIY